MLTAGIPVVIHNTDKIFVEKKTKKLMSIDENYEGIFFFLLHVGKRHTNVYNLIPLEIIQTELASLFVQIFIITFVIAGQRIVISVH